jgi:protein-S-isoprenylcysteine O-methyltransferase Ste14
MNGATLWRLAWLPWCVFAAYWAISLLKVKRTKAAEPATDRLQTIAAMAVAFELLLGNLLRVGPLKLRFLPRASWIPWAGIGLTWLGTLIAIWARYSIGAYWSGRITLKEGHRLIRSGPYGYVRHPIYTGMLVAATGTALVVGEWRGVLAVAIILVAHSLKALREERMLMREFGQEYEDYRRSTGFLIPRIFG